MPLFRFNQTLLFLLLIGQLFAQTNLDTTGLNKVLKKVWHAPSFFMIGEAHEVAGTHELQIQLIRKLYQQGYHTLILECGHAEAAIYQSYIQGGADSILYNTRARGAYYASFIKNLRKYVPDIQLKGIDFEYGICIRYVLDNLIAAINHPQLHTFTQLLEQIQTNSSPIQLRKLLFSLKKEYVQHEKLLDSILHSPDNLLRNIIFNPVLQADFSFSSHKRDAAILQNLLQQTSDQLEHSILIFGSNHFTNSKHLWELFSQQKEGKLAATLCLFAYHACENYMRKKPYGSAKLLYDLGGFESVETDTGFVRFKLTKNAQLGKLQADNLVLIAQLFKQ